MREIWSTFYGQYYVKNKDSLSDLTKESYRIFFLLMFKNFVNFGDVSLLLLITRFYLY